MKLKRVYNFNIKKVVRFFFKKQEKRYHSAFTLAEVLLTLVLVGVVAALTLPTLITNCQKIISKNKVKKAYALLSQTTRMAENDYGNVSTWQLPEGDSWQNAKTFTDTYISPYLKVSHSCKQRNNEKNCDYNMYGLNGTAYRNIYKDKTYRFYMVDGTFVMVWAFYRPNYSGHKKRASIFFDIDGPRGANTVGKDIFKLEYIIESTTKEASKIGKILPAWIDEDRARLMSNRNEMCNTRQDGIACLALIYKDGWDIASDYPWK